MEIINHECYVSLEVAKLLKQAGFDWEVKSYRKGLNGIFETTSIPNNFNDGTLTDWISAPTLEVAQRWLRETQKYHVEVSCAEEKGYLPIYFLYKTNITQNFVFYPTYEEAQEAGIKKALEIILEK